MPDNLTALPKLDVRRLPGPENIHRRVLPNGITVLARENFTSPSVVVSGYLTAGSLDENPEMGGLAFLTAQALMRGTKKRTFQDIFETIESIGSRLAFGAGAHTTRFFAKALVEAQNGTIAVESQVGQGSVFTVTLPRVAVHGEAESTASA